jgi:hypothetical protein
MTIAAACLAALLAGQGADITTGLRLGPGFREGNPLLPSSLRATAVVKVAATTALAISGWRIRKTKPKLAIGLFVAGAVSGTVGAWHNARLQRKGRP